MPDEAAPRLAGFRITQVRIPGVVEVLLDNTEPIHRVFEAVVGREIEFDQGCVCGEGVANTPRSRRDGGAAASRPGPPFCRLLAVSVPGLEPCDEVWVRHVVTHDRTVVVAPRRNESLLRLSRFDEIRDRLIQRPRTIRRPGQMPVEGTDVGEKLHHGRLMDAGVVGQALDSSITVVDNPAGEHRGTVRCALEVQVDRPPSVRRRKYRRGRFTLHPHSSAGCPSLRICSSPIHWWKRAGMAKHVEIAGGLEPVNDGERRVLEAFIEGLPSEYRVFSNVQVAGARGRVDDCDLIVITPKAVVIVEVKDLAGTVIVNEHSYYVDGEERSNPVITTEFKAKRIKSRLARSAPLRDVRVEAIVVLARTPKHLTVDPHFKERVLLTDAAVARLSNPHAFGTDAGAVLERRAAIEGALNLQPRRTPQKFGEYKVRHIKYDTPEEQRFTGVHELTGEDVVIRRIVFSPLADPEVVQARRRRVLRAVKAFQKVDDNARVANPGIVMEMDDGSLVLITPDRGAVSLSERVLQDDPLDRDARVRIVNDVAAGLAALTRAGVAHRLLTPDAIDISPDGVARIADLESAQIGESTGKTIVLDELDDLAQDFVAPEVILDPSAAGPAADLHSLGTLIAWLWPDAARGPGLPAIGPAPKELDELVPTLTQYEAAHRTTDPSAALLAGQRVLIGVGAASEDADTPPPWPPAIIDTFEINDQILDGDHPAFAAKDLASGEACFLKIYPEDNGLAAVQRQYNALVAAAGPGIIRARHAGLSPYGAYLVTELLDGPDLRADIDAGARYAAVAVPMIEVIVAGLGRLHDRTGAAHGDVKPANLFAGDGTLTLVDFDLCGVDPSVVGGTAGYVPPDGARVIDPDRDLYASAVVLHELITGQLPTDGPAGSLAAPMLDFLGRALAPSRADRFPDAAAMLEALDHLRRSLNGFTLGPTTIEVSNTGFEHGLTSAAGEPVSEARTTTYRVSVPGSGALDVTVFRSTGSDAAWIQATREHGATPLLAGLVGRARISITRDPERGSWWMELLGSTVADGKRPGKAKITAEELSAILGTDATHQMLDIGASAFGTRANVRDDASNRRNYLCVEFDDPDAASAIAAYVLTRVLPLLKT